jgi:hypothetical protein
MTFIERSSVTWRTKHWRGAELLIGNRLQSWCNASALGELEAGTLGEGLDGRPLSAFGVSIDIDVGGGPGS